MINNTTKPSERRVSKILLSLVYIGATLMILLNTVQCINLSLIRDESVKNQLQTTWRTHIEKGSSNKCCLPDTYTLSMTNGVNRKNVGSDGTPSPLIQFQTQTSTVWYDKKSWRMRTDSNGTSSTGQPMKTSQILFRLGGTDFEYNIVNGDCSCRLTKLTWDKTCFSLEQTTSVGKIGDFEATNVFLNSIPNQFFFSQWTLRDSSMEKNTCFPLSVEFVHDDTSLLQNVYNQVKTVDPTAFRLTLTCPVLSSCQ